MPPNLAHTCHGSTSQMTSWLNCSQLLCIPNFTPYDNWQLAHQICFKPQNCLMLFGHWSKGMCSFQFIINNKQLWGHPPTHFPCIDGITSYKRSTFPQLQTTMYTTSSLSNRKCNIMLSLDKSLCKILKWCITFIMFMNAHANFTQFCL